MAPTGSNKRKRPPTPDYDEEEDEEGPDELAEDDNEEEWTITYPTKPGKVSSAKNRAIWTGADEHISPFHAKGAAEDALNCKYVVKQPAWKEMKEYKKFIVDNEKYSSGDYVYVLPPTLTRVSEPKDKDFWIAMILEIRAADASNVFVLVVWLYWPEQLIGAHVGKEKAEGGARAYHGKSELIASNHLEILNVHSFAGKATVEHWLEEDDGSIQEELYWRQTYDIHTRNLSALRKHCACGKYDNPDNVMLACPNPECNIWLHTECLLNNALFSNHREIRRAEKKPIHRSSSSSKTRPHEVDLHASQQMYRKSFSGKIVDDNTKIEITDLRTKEVWKEPIRCLECDSVLD